MVPERDTVGGYLSLRGAGYPQLYVCMGKSNKKLIKISTPLVQGALCFLLDGILGSMSAIPRRYNLIQSWDNRYIMPSHCIDRRHAAIKVSIP